ncbi:uncharacterized protein LOC141854727 [Brevipalpus obovatus]|uniref:uncharacterized protein LOC141854727 n=1 Tax=Brevipalpus obovatus TaxID=246614 RepID=UPI003D9F65F5
MPTTKAIRGPPNLTLKARVNNNSGELTSVPSNTCSTEPSIVKNGDNGTSPKPRAQRKFASFASCCTLLKPQDTDFSSVTEIFPKFKPLTEDFLTFICFRGSGLLPPHLDFYALNGISEPKCETSPIDDEKDLTTDQSDLNVSRRTLANPGKLKRMGVAVNKSKKTHQIENQSESQYNNSKSSKNRVSSETNSPGKSVNRNERYHQRAKSKRIVKESLKSSNKVSTITTTSPSTTSSTPNKSHCKVQSIRTISTRQTVISPPKQESTDSIKPRIIKVDSFTSTPTRKTRQSPLHSSSSSSSSSSPDKVVTPIFKLENVDKNLTTNGNRYSLASDRVLRSSHRSRSNQLELNLQMSKSNLDLKRIESKKSLRKLPLEDSSSAIYGIKKGNNLRSRLTVNNTKEFVVVDGSLKEKIVKKSAKVKSNHLQATIKPNSSTKITNKYRSIGCTNMINGIITRSASRKPGNIQGNHHH